MCSNPNITSWGGKASNSNLQLVILSLWGIWSVIPLTNICLGMIPNLICWQWVGLRAPICCYLDSTLPGRSGVFTPVRPDCQGQLTSSQRWLKWETCRRKEDKEDEVERCEGCLRMPLRFSIGARRGLFGMTECLANLAGKPTQMWGWDGCRGAEGGCKWWMAVVRRSNCVQVIDPAPSLFLDLLPVGKALHLSFTCVPQMVEKNISKERPVSSLGSWLV